MGLRNFLINKLSSIETPKKEFSFFMPMPIQTEQFKGVAQEDNDKTQIGKDKDIGEDHPYNFELTIGIYKSFGLAHAAVAKIVDFTIGAGYYVKSDNPDAEELINDFLETKHFDTLLRLLATNALTTGNGYLELSGGINEVPDNIKVLDPKFIYVKRDKYGTVEGYTQFINSMTTPVPFDPHEIIHLKHNVIASEAYGLGILYPGLNHTNKLLECETDMQTLIKRKANSPLHVKVGDPTKNIVPGTGDISAISGRLASMKANQEFVTDPYWDIKVIDFGALPDKFTMPMKYYEDMLFFTYQVPEVLMGRGNVSEGLAKVQMKAFEGTISAFQEEISNVLEEQLFKRILEANGILDAELDFEWGAASDEDNMLEVDKLTALLNNPSLDPSLHSALEAKLVLLLNLDTMTSKAALPQKSQEKFKLDLRITEKNNITLSEWINNERFNYKIYLNGINKFLESKNAFSDLKAKNDKEIAAGKLDDYQISQLKKVLKVGFGASLSLAHISGLIEKKVQPSDLYEITKDGALGELIATAATRVDSIARTETVRAANEGALIHYDETNVDTVEWNVSSGGCEDCASHEGETLSLDDASAMIPAHPNCRCSWSPVITEKVKL